MKDDQCILDYNAEINRYFITISLLLEGSTNVDSLEIIKLWC